MRHQQNCIVLGHFKISTEKAKEKSTEEETHNLGKTENRILHRDSDQLSPTERETREITPNLLL